RHQSRNESHRRAGEAAAASAAAVFGARRVQRMVLDGPTADGIVILFVTDLAVLGADQPRDSRFRTQLCRWDLWRKIYFGRRRECGAVGGSGTRLRRRCARRGGLNFNLKNHSMTASRRQ